MAFFLNTNSRRICGQRQIINLDRNRRGINDLNIVFLSLRGGSVSSGINGRKTNNNTTNGNDYIYSRNQYSRQKRCIVAVPRRPFIVSRDMQPTGRTRPDQQMLVVVVVFAVVGCGGPSTARHAAQEDVQPISVGRSSAYGERVRVQRFLSKSSRLPSTVEKNYVQNNPSVKVTRLHRNLFSFYMILLPSELIDFLFI